MWWSNPLILGMVLVVIGVIFWGITRLALNFIPRLRPSTSISTFIQQPVTSELSEHRNAVLLVRPGGRLISVNNQARLLFHLESHEPPNLEKCIRRIRPPEPFLGLCMAEGSAKFILDGKEFEGTSYLIAGQPESSMLVAFKLTSVDVLQGVEKDTGGLQSYRFLAEMAAAMAASLDLNDTLRAIFEILEKCLPADIVQVALWNWETETLTSYRYSGSPDSDRKLEEQKSHERLGEGFSGYIAKERHPLFVPNIDAQSALHPGTTFTGIHLASYMGVPLTVDERFIGTLEVGSTSPGSIQESDLDLLTLLSGQAAIAIHNALLYREEQRRATELSALAQLSQAIGSARESKTMFARLVQSVVPLIDVGILGFLIYNENERVLEGQIPFYGLPPQFVEIYRVSILSNSAAEQTLLDGDVLITEHASDDPQWETLGLEHLAQAASLRDTVLMPLAAGGRMLGYLQASNHTNGSNSFTQDELHLLMIVANQAAPVIENANLVHQTRLRAQRAEGLRRIASLVSSSANVDEILKFSLQELAHLIRADMAAAFLLDRNRTALQLQRASIYGSASLPLNKPYILPADDPQFPFTVIASHHALLSGNLSEERAIIPFYQQIRSDWRAETIGIVPMVVRDVEIGELWMISHNPDAFDQGDIQIVTTAAGQLAGVIEQSHLANQTDESLRRRIEQLTALTRISRELSTTLDLDSLLHMVFDEALRTLRADCGTVLILDDTLTSEQPYRIRHLVGDALPVPVSDMEKSVLASGKPLLVADVSRAEMKPPHGGILSFLIIPIYYQQKPVGLITLHSRTANRFDQSALDIAQSLAAQTGIALGNALRYEEESRHGALLGHMVETLNQLGKVLKRLHSDSPLEEALGLIVSSLQQITPFKIVVISRYDPLTGCLTRVQATGLDAVLWKEMQAYGPAWKSFEKLFDPQFKHGAVYFLPEEQIPEWVDQEIHTVTALPPAEKKGPEIWNPGDMLLLPLYSSTGEPLALLSMDAPENNLRPDNSTYETLELFGMVTGLMIENRQSVSTLEKRISEMDLPAGLEQSSAYRAQIPALLHKDLQQTISIQSLTRQITQIRDGLEIIQEVGKQTDALGVMRSLARELLTRFDMQAGMIAETTPIGPRLIDSIGWIPEGANPEALFGQLNPLRQLLQDRQLVLEANISQNSNWQNSPMLAALDVQSMIGMPLTIGSSQTAAVMVFGNRILTPFTREDQEMFNQITMQVSVLLQNLHLLDETRRRLGEVDLLLDFSRKLSSLDPIEILHTLVNGTRHFMPHAHAGWAALWEPKEHSLVTRAAAGYPNSQSLLKVSYDRITEKDQLPVVTFVTHLPQRVSEVDFAQNYHLSADDLMRYRQATGGRLPVASMFIPIRRGNTMMGVLTVDNFTTAGAFSEDDELMALSLAQQAALALETANQYASSESRAAQLQALTRVGSAITSSLQLDALIASLLDMLKAVLPYETATLWLKNERRLTVAAASGFQDPGQRVGLSVAVEDSLLFQQMMTSGEPIYVSDVREDSRFPTLIEAENLTWLGLPLIAKSELIGIMALEKKEAGFYTSDHLQAATAFASQAAVALDNARLYAESVKRASELDERSKRLALLNHLSGELSGLLEVDRILDLALQQLQQALACSRVSAVLVPDPFTSAVYHEFPAGKNELPIFLPAVPWLNRMRETLGVYNTNEILDEADLQDLNEAYFSPNGIHSLLVVPLVAGISLQGWFWLQNTESRRFLSPEIELARTISNQVAISMQNARLISETRSLNEDLERRVEVRTAELRHEHRNTEILLRIITELSASLDMDQVLNRTLAILNKGLEAEQGLIILAEDRTHRYQDGIPLVGFEKAKNNGHLPEEEIARWVGQNRATALVEDAHIDTRWEFSPEALPKFRSVIGVPLLLGQDVLGTLLLFHREPEKFSHEQTGLVEAAARQIAIALNNGQLFNLIRDQSEKLGAMLRDQQIEASRSRAILESVADGVVVTDRSSKVTLFNVSSERILELKTEQVIGQSLPHLGELVGQSVRSWVGTILSWSHDPVPVEKAEAYSEQVELENKQVIAIRLSPVYWRSEFMGTVTIFRDITHEVQVDRMKTEFVANVSHELRTPMTSIKGYVEIMLMGAAGEVNDQQRRFLGIVKSNTERLNVLVNDLLDVSRIEAGRVRLNLSSVDMRHVAEDVISDLIRRSREENKPIHFSLESPEKLPLIRGDAERVRQILMHLVSNGYNYTPENGNVSVLITVQGGEIQVDVHDSGIGISSEERPRIFERFYRGNDSLVLATAGNGLGLTLAKTLVEMHHGRIWFESSGETGKGTTFSFALPVMQVKE
jgi:PAS domain S-box-containing protein